LSEQVNNSLASTRTSEQADIELPACQNQDLEEKQPETKKPQKKDGVVTGEELLLKPLIELPMLLEPLLPKSGLAVLAGSSDSGKSSLLRQLSIEIVLKKENAFGMKLKSTHHSVIIASSEDDENAIAFLLNKQNVSSAKAADFKALKYIFDSGNLLQTLDKELTKGKADLIVLDTLTDFYTNSDFNNVAAVRSFFKGYQQLAAKHTCLVIFNHHLSKSKEHSMPSKNALLGSMGVESKARVVLELRKDRFDKNLRHLIPLKGNYLNEEQKSKSLVLKFDENMLFTNTGQMI
jgi:archaellum biogenesis ATPase FlaH